jgi:hypothetical protein
MAHRERREKEKIAFTPEVPSFSLIALREKKMAHRERREKEVDSVYSGSFFFFSYSSVRKII